MLRTFKLIVGSMDSFSNISELLSTSPDNENRAEYEVSGSTLEVSGMTSEEVFSCLLWGKASDDGWSKHGSISQIQEVFEETPIFEEILVLNDLETYSAYPDNCIILEVDKGVTCEEMDEWVKDNLHKGKFFTRDGWKTVDLYQAVLVLDDGETYTDLIGCYMMEIPADLEQDKVDDYIKTNIRSGTKVWK